MKAILVHPETKQLYIDQTDRPTPHHNEVLVKVKATALNRADLLQKRGLYPPPAGASPILGLEMSGVIEELGLGVTKWKIGDRVCALLPGGGYAEYVSVPEDIAIPIPEALSFEEAAAIPEVFLTAYLNMFWLGQLKKDDTILIHAGASGVGTAAIQMAHDVGAHIITTAGSKEKLDLCKSLGADIVVNYREESFTEKVAEFTSGKGADIIFDFIGASYWEQNLKSLSIDGRLILIGTMGGSEVEKVNLGLLLSKRIQVIGTALRTQPIEKKIALTNEFKTNILPKIANGTIKPLVDSVWSWTDANEAHAHMEDNQNAGKIVLTVIP